MHNDRIDIANRMRAAGLASGVEVDPGEKVGPRWRIDPEWVEFECGCRAERCLNLHGLQVSDPIIFGGTAQQAVYDFVCDAHGPGMNKWMGFGGKGLTFNQWRRVRRSNLMNEVHHESRHRN